MSSLEETIATWASIAATLVTVIGLIQSQPWLVTVSAAFVAVSAIALVYAKRQRLRLASATIKIEGRSIDSLNLANLRRRVNRSLLVQNVDRVITVDGEDLTFASTYTGFCRSARESAMEFSIDSDSNIPFERLDCFGYDLQEDPHMNNPIRPILQGTDGSSKKIAVPFSRPLRANQPFRVLLRCARPGCMTMGLEYCTAALSFDQDRVPAASVQLVFRGGLPDWVRVYEVDASGTPRLLRNLPAMSVEEPGSCHYTDEATLLAGQSVRVYLFYRATR